MPSQVSVLVVADCDHSVVRNRNRPQSALWGCSAHRRTSCSSPTCCVPSPCVLRLCVGQVSLGAMGRNLTQRWLSTRRRTTKRERPRPSTSSCVRVATGLCPCTTSPSHNVSSRSTGTTVYPTRSSHRTALTALACSDVPCSCMPGCEQHEPSLVAEHDCGSSRPNRTRAGCSGVEMAIPDLILPGRTWCVLGWPFCETVFAHCRGQQGTLP